MDDQAAIIVTTTTRPGMRDEVRALYEQLLAPRATRLLSARHVGSDPDHHQSAIAS